MDCVVTPLKTLMGFSVHLNVQFKFYNLPFVLLLIFIFTRKVDGSGLVQTPEVKMITWYVLDVPFVLLVIVQVVWGIIIKKQR
ncbi:DUF3923 family protein [Levilactobacillus brevis]|jgi:hypothetical protein|uniref:Uncharacterized protein n=5 Tax=Levilactobacillus brevis TaxID=1580 RepID=Q03SG2_LEVBA|nr:DUF3923 family protein [Levilactobacillus brevis]ABJ63860.1 hypothetical protein LVIS_0717 [Levilactobacillus brevis ATCC 367]KWU39163.1 hypothetical protein AV935_11790 [Levilactobacillus brevis]MCS6164671.1 DUF3923 family protein [Levilactobacillus brevis]MCT3581478.1 DUF3923 family protein [Levilactobacillus brevis]MCT3591175.1 DUF3923 family protein [Levilactobacillus brevis]